MTGRRSPFLSLCLAAAAVGGTLLPAGAAAAGLSAGEALALGALWAAGMAAWGASAGLQAACQRMLGLPALQQQLSQAGVEAEETGQVLRQLSAAVGLQLQLVQRLSGSIPTLVVGIERTSRAAEDAAVAANETANVAQSGTQVGQLAVGKLRLVFEQFESVELQVQRFGLKSKQIGKIVEVITKLSQQTNLLALNATLEAARAGEYGRGFAVVADEIRKLAVGSAASAEQIARLIDESVTEAQGVVLAMGASAQALSDGREDMNAMLRGLENIAGSASRGVEVVGQIARLAPEQSGGAREMSLVLDNMNQLMTQQGRALEQGMAQLTRQRAPSSADAKP